MDTAPMDASEVEILLDYGDTVIAHWAQGMSGEDQPPFRGWFVTVRDAEGRATGYREIQQPEGWRPIK